MSVFASILLPLDGSLLAAQGLGTAIWMADTLGARLHVLNATPDPLPAREALVRLKVPEHYWSHITLHQLSDEPVEAILQAIVETEADLVIMSARGQTVDAEPAGDFVAEVGHVARAVIERCEPPVLLLPRHYVERLPWRTALVPLSGETEADQIIALVMELAEELDLHIQIAHVVNDGKYGFTTEVQYSDSPFHEYAGRLQDLLDRASLQCSPSACQCRIEDVSLLRGNVSRELIELIHSKHVDLLAIGWHGMLVRGHAHVVREFLDVLTCPVLLQKAEPSRDFELKVGEALE